MRTLCSIIGTPGRLERIPEVATLTEVQRIARRLKAAETRTDKIRAERDTAIVSAHAAGESPSLIAIVAGLSEQAVFKILRARREGRDG
jgi:hypothetical protein